MISIDLDGEPTRLPPGATLADVAALHDGRLVALALNGRVVMRPTWAATRLAEGDEVRIVRAIGAG